MKEEKKFKIGDEVDLGLWISHFKTLDTKRLKRIEKALFILETDSLFRKHGRFGRLALLIRTILEIDRHEAVRG